jgi:hypothetical protein
MNCRGWMNSPGHRENMLKKYWKRVLESILKRRDLRRLYTSHRTSAEDRPVLERDWKT